MTRIIAEIRRRKVGRVAVAYAAAAFVVLQVGDIVLAPVGAPAWVMTVVIVLTALGFPVAVALAWAFDVTPDGVRRTAPVAAAHGVDRLLDRRGVAVVAGVALISLGAGAGYVWSRGVNVLDLDPDLVVILPFRVSADPSISYLREGMVDLLATSLSADGGLRATEPRTALSAWRRVTRDESIDLATEEAVQVAQLVGAGRLVLGSVLATGSEITLTASLVQVGSRRNVDARASGSPDSITRLIDELSAQLLSRAAGESETRLESLTSTSLPALRAYLEGQSAYRRSQFGRAMQAFDRAVEIDSTFALASLYLEVTHGWGDAITPNQPRAARLAHHFRERLSPSDRVMLDAFIGADYPRPRNTADILRAWEHALAQLPDRADALFAYGDQLMHYGRLVDRADHVDAALEIFRRALAIDPSFTPALIHVLDIAMYRGEAEDARRAFDLLVRTDTSAHTAAYQYYGRLTVFGDTAQLAAFRRGLDTVTTNLRFGVGVGYAMHNGDPADARTALELNLRKAVTAQERNEALENLYRLSLNFGRPGDALRYARTALALPDANETRWRSYLVLDAMFWGGDTIAATSAAAALRSSGAPGMSSGAVACVLGQWSAWRGEFDHAAAHAQQLEQVSVSAEARDIDRICALTVRAIAANLQGGHAAHVLLERADSAAAAGPLEAYALLRAVNSSLARLHASAGSLERAFRANDRFALAPAGLIGWSTWALERARLAGALGDHVTARAAYSDYLRVRFDPEPALLPERHAAEAALLRLGTDRAN
jgi:tetratricopeptide (TPR) repeat protein